MYLSEQMNSSYIPMKNVHERFKFIIWNPPPIPFNWTLEHIWIKTDSVISIQIASSSSSSPRLRLSWVIRSRTKNLERAYFTHSLNDAKPLIETKLIIKWDQLHYSTPQLCQIINFHLFIIICYGFFWYAVHVNLFQLGSTSPKKQFTDPGCF